MQEDDETVNIAEEMAADRETVDVEPVRLIGERAFSRLCSRVFCLRGRLAAGHLFSMLLTSYEPLELLRERQRLSLYGAFIVSYNTTNGMYGVRLL